MLLERLEILNHNLLKFCSVREKIAYLDSNPTIFEFIKKNQRMQEVLTPESEWIFKQMIAIGQGESLLACPSDRLNDLFHQLSKIDRFYQELGGIIGYQVEVLRKLKPTLISGFKEATFHSPHFHDISQKTDEVEEAIHDGIEALASTAEFYPLGGAADRLHLTEDGTGQDLPAAKMAFAGRSLLECLIRDLEAREHLYYQRTHRKIEVPIGIMTSPEKDNHRLVIEICESNRWFGRKKENFRFFCQPLVPAVDSEGNWIWIGTGKPLLKPGGHGAIWKLARDEGVFEWLKRLGVKQMIVRQINNPLAGLDYGLLAFLGLGAKKKMTFGFVSCPRLLKTAEGVNVLVERKKEESVERVLTNIEYCDFSRYGIDDAPLKEGEPYSRFTCNTNILFANLEKLEEAVRLAPFPGLLINLKKTSYLMETGEKREAIMARLESTMQNIADVFVEEHPISNVPKTDRTFVTYNHRHKTISTAKKAYHPGMSLQETPEHCFYDLLQASRELLIDSCNFRLPPKRTIEEMQRLGPECSFLYHPVLGPLYSIIAQKISGGRIGSGSELQLEIGEVEIKNLDLEGSLRVLAERPVLGRCILRNVQIRNRGVDWSSSSPFWKYQLTRFESTVIRLKGRSEFIAEDLLVLGDREWVVEDGMRMIVEKEGTVKLEALPI